jgi:hypothetical protein
MEPGVDILRLRVDLVYALSIEGRGPAFEPVDVVAFREEGLASVNV